MPTTGSASAGCRASSTRSTKLTAEISEGNGGLGRQGSGSEYKVDEKRTSYLNYGYSPDRTDIINRGGAGLSDRAAHATASADSFSVFGEERLRYGGGYSGV